MSKWPKGLAKQLNATVRDRLLPVFADHGFVEFPHGGGNGRYWGGAYCTDLLRTRGSEADIVCVSVDADGFHPLVVIISAVRTTIPADDLTTIPTVSRFPIGSRFTLMPPLTWRNFLRPIFKLGPPWPDDRDKAIGLLIEKIEKSLPRMFDFFDTGEVPYPLRRRKFPRVPVSLAY